MRRLLVLPLAALALVPALALAGCGETVVDSAKAEELLESESAKLLGQRPDGQEAAQKLGISANAKVTSVDCPSGEEVTAGAEFTCTMAYEGGSQVLVVLKIVNGDADLGVESVAAAGKGE